MDVVYKTSSHNKMVLSVDIHMIPREEVPLGSYDKSICGDCKGYNGGCVGFAPHFSILKPSAKYLLALSVEMDMSWAIAYAHNSGHAKQSNYYRLTYADRLTESFLRRVLTALNAKVKGYVLGAGNCSGCGTALSSKMCGVMLDGKCLHPDKRTFSLEATCVNCSDLCNMTLGHRLWWWYKDEVLPRKMSRFAGILTNISDMHLSTLGFEDIVRADKACVDQEDIGEYAYPVYDAVVPEGFVDAGMHYDAYCMTCEGA
jgi:hypothetical protein